ncbi:type II toxin-antitoxin system HigB family toxin [Brenneria tiliae]|uniref:type II toxin-antitoxin system HigB family toxin n=1 Tax=Brenneria tiliae TaxID=2914984 RepID=UPI0020149291|nr:type II toxin-antitoxin system HigB family toxin [Brenneria tiliae]MCL2899293.1 type II toxin-antitoxin system HigB family toxin [Brenneria tiliae]MCL2903671.1 type II toxin-antitoxin system HigB family toxin [Brenneria tiliae]
MHVISRLPFNEAALKYPNSATALFDLLSILEKQTFTSPDEMRKQFPSLDNFKYRNKWWVIDVSGNTLRLMAFIDYRLQKVFVKHIVTHAEYDKLTKSYREHKE